MEFLMYAIYRANGAFIGELSLKHLDECMVQFAYNRPQEGTEQRNTRAP